MTSPTANPVIDTANDKFAATVLAELDRIRPMLQTDGGDMEFLGLEPGGVVRLRLIGACAECPSQVLTLKAGIEARLRERLPQVTRVVAVPADPAPPS